MNACGLMSFDLGQCISGTAWGWAAGLASLIPLWGWIVIALIVVGLVWKFAGWPGIVGLALAIGIAIGKNGNNPVSPPAAKAAPAPKPAKPPRKKMLTLEEMFKRK